LLAVTPISMRFARTRGSSSLFLRPRARRRYALTIAARLERRRGGAWRAAAASSSRSIRAIRISFFVSLRRANMGSSGSSVERRFLLKGFAPNGG
jgi:hypothetical protein